MKSYKCYVGLYDWTSSLFPIVPGVWFKGNDERYAFIQVSSFQWDVLCENTGVITRNCSREAVNSLINRYNLFPEQPTFPILTSSDIAECKLYESFEGELYELVSSGYDPYLGYNDKWTLTSVKTGEQVVELYQLDMAEYLNDNGFRKAKPAKAKPKKTKSKA